jgi:uncharacterized protein (DUF433 family)
MAEHIIVPINYIEKKPNSSKYRIVGKGVTVDFLSLFIDDSEWPMERICQNYSLTPSEVYAAWSFYYDHKEEIDQRLQDAAARFDTAYAQDQDRRERLRQQYQNNTGQPFTTNDD